MEKYLLAAMLSLPPLAMASPPPSAPPEVMAAAPKGTTLLFFASSGNQSNADAAAVFETTPDKDGVKWRTLSLFGRKEGKFVEDFSNDKLIACSKCSQYHDEQFYTEMVQMSPGHIYIEQQDGGEKPSTTILDFQRKSGKWMIAKATRETVDFGRYNDRTEKLPIPKSGLAVDMDIKWIVPTYLNTLLLNKKDNSFSFLHGHPTTDAMWSSRKGDCNQTDCTILVQQGDGCISLVRDASQKSFAGKTANPKGKNEAVADAMKACESANGIKCEEVRTDCTRGIL